MQTLHYRCARYAWLALVLAGSAVSSASAQAPAGGAPKLALAESPTPQVLTPTGPAATTIDLASALRLAGVENPQILIARQRVVEAMALRQLAAAQILP